MGTDHGALQQLLRYLSVHHGTLRIASNATRTYIFVYSLVGKYLYTTFQEVIGAW